jgi:DNA-binding response OmpR family regulator
VAAAAADRPDTAPLVLIADDNDDAREMYAIYLEHAGFRTDRGGRGWRDQRTAIWLR